MEEETHPIEYVATWSDQGQIRKGRVVEWLEDAHKIDPFDGHEIVRVRQSDVIDVKPVEDVSRFDQQELF